MYDNKITKNCTEHDKTSKASKSNELQTSIKRKQYIISTQNCQHVIVLTNTFRTVYNMWTFHLRLHIAKRGTLKRKRSIISIQTCAQVVHLHETFPTICDMSYSVQNSSHKRLRKLRRPQNPEGRPCVTSARNLHPGLGERGGVESIARAVCWRDTQDQGGRYIGGEG